MDMQPTRLEYTEPIDIPKDIAIKLLKMAEAFHEMDYYEAYHQLYSIADPSFTSYQPFEVLAKVVEA